MDLSRLVAPVEQAASAVRRRWERHDLARRLWEGDPTVWSSDRSTPELSNRLGWLRLHETMRSEVEGIERLAEKVGPVDRVLLCGMGGSSLAPEVFASALGGAGPELVVLDSTHPDRVADVLESVDSGRTVFVISSKSGTTLETLSFFRTFWEASGGDGSRFVAVTDPGTPLEELGRERGFREVMTADPSVGGRFSALTHFGLVPAALCGIGIGPLLDAAAEMAERGPEEAGVGLGQAWGALALAGSDKLTLVTSPRLDAFPAWMEQLIAESLGKQGAGIVPVAGEPLGSPAVYRADRAFLGYVLEGEAGPDLALVVSGGFPALAVTLASPAELAGEMLRAEVATATAGEVLGVHPFDQPDVEAAKKLAREAMSAGAAAASAETHQPAEGAGRLRRLLEEAAPGDYFAIQAYLAPSQALEEQLTRLRLVVRGLTGVATTSGWGPRYLHSTGQLHKGGPNSGVFLQLVDRPRRDVAVPETELTFGRIVAAQAAGDHRALIAAGRRVVRVDLGEDAAAGIAELAEGLE